ncbi:MAG: tyrosine-type recombinase/integrase [Acidobacteriaceae bacterium]|nr:tyrosine-type recombinase/integrase [Acidobacteriaceae bacterium]
MNLPDLLLQVECYVGLRRAVGYTVRYEEKLLKEFVQFLASQDSSSPIRAQMAVDWACAPVPGRGLAGQASRLRVVRGFLSHLRAALPETEVPGPGVLAPLRRPSPYLYSQGEMEALMQEALRLRPEDSLRPHVYCTLIGLLASSGLRVGEALRLNMEDVRLDAATPHLHISEGKFRKSRLVPLHATTAEQLVGYAKERKRLGCDALSDAFFVSEKGGPLTYDACCDTFGGLLRRTGIRKDAGSGRPGMHGLRHSFAVGRMVAWYRAGMTVKDLLPHLSVYLGHVQPAHTYWYLTATPELLGAAADRFLQYAGMGGRHD